MTNPTEGGSFGRVGNVLGRGAAVALLYFGTGGPVQAGPQSELQRGPQSGPQAYEEIARDLRYGRLQDRQDDTVSVVGNGSSSRRSDADGGGVSEYNLTNEVVEEASFALEVGTMALLSEDETVIGGFDRMRGSVVFTMRRGELPQGSVWFAYRLNGNQTDLRVIQETGDRRLVGFRHFNGSETFTLESINDDTGNIELSILSGRWFNDRDDYDTLTFPSDSGADLIDGRNYTAYFDDDGRIYTAQVLDDDLLVQSRDISPGSQRRLRTFEEDVSADSGDEVPANEQICGMTMTSDGGVWVVLKDRITRVQRGSESSQRVQLAGGSRVLIPRSGVVDDTVRLLNASGLIETYKYEGGLWTKAGDIVTEPPRIEQDGSVAVPAILAGKDGSTYLAYSTAKSNERANADNPFVYVVGLSGGSINNRGTGRFAVSESGGLQGIESHKGYARLDLPQGAYTPGRSAGFNNGTVSVTTAGISAFGKNMAGPGGIQLFYAVESAESIMPASREDNSYTLYLPVAVNSGDAG